MEQAKINLEKLFPCWKKLTRSQQSIVAASATQRTFLKGGHAHDGGECSGLFIIKEGQLRVFILSNTGREITLYRLFDWDICLFSASCVMKNIDFDLYVQAEKDTDVVVIPAEVYETLLKESLPVSDYTNQLMASRFSDVMWTMEKVLFTSFDKRLATFLLDQSSIENTITLRITHDEIAKHLGSAREVVTKMLNYLSTEGMVKLSRGKIELMDIQKLDELSTSQ